MPVQRGTYELTFDIAGDAEMPITLDVYEHPGRTAARAVMAIGNLGALTFSTSGATALEFRVFGEDDLDFQFSGVKLRFVSESLLEE